MRCISPNPRRVGYIDPIHGPLDGPLYIASHIHQHTTVVASETNDTLSRDMSIIIFAYVAPTMRRIGTTSRESMPTSQQHAKATMIATTNVEKFDIK